MIKHFKPSDLCALAEHWIAKHGLASLDPLQQHRFAEHAMECPHCANVAREGGAASRRNITTNSFGNTDDVDAVMWPHLAEDTLRAWRGGLLTSTERSAVAAWIGAHLQHCDFCGDRFAVIDENPETPTTDRRAVLGRAAPTPIVWSSSRSELAWVIDQPAVGATTWRISLELTEGSLSARLNVEGDLVPHNWSFSVPLSTDSALLPTLVFGESNRAVTRACAAGPDATWRATPILTAEIPSWSRLLVAGEEPATMVSTEDATRRDITIRVPGFSDLTDAAVASWIDQLFVDLRGDKLSLAPIGTQSLDIRSGRVVSSESLEVGVWELSARPDRWVELKLIPNPGEIIRIRTQVTEYPGLAEWVTDSLSIREATEAAHFVSHEFAQQVAFRPSLLRSADQEHLDQCETCRERIEHARIQSHPGVGDLLLYYAKHLPEADTAAIHAHLAPPCRGALCTALATLAEFPNWLAEHAATVTSQVKAATGWEAPLPEAGLAFSSGTNLTPLYSANLQHDGWEVNLEQSGTQAFFIGIRSLVDRDAPPAVYVALIRGSSVIQGQFDWDPTNYWPARGFIAGADQLLRANGPLCVVVVPRVLERPGAETR